MIEFRTLGTLDLRRPDVGELRAVLTQPRPLALLAYLALATPRGFHRRDTLLALFWPELDREHARAALRKALHTLRHALGEGVLIGRGDEEVGLDPQHLWCDAVAFQQAAEGGNHADAVALYRGDLLAGFYASDASQEFERWLDEERNRLHAKAAQVAWALAKAAESARDVESARRWAARAVTLAPDDEGSLRRVIALLDRLGDRAAAVHVYEEFAERLAREYEVEPSAETKALVDAVRQRQVPRPLVDRKGGPPAESVGGGGAVAPRAPSGAGPAPVAGRERPAPRRLRWAVLGALTGAAVIAAAAMLTSRSRDDANPVIAVGGIRDYGRSELGNLSGPLVDMLATNLARIAGLHVVSNARIQELVRVVGQSDTGAALARAARAAGASEIVEGALYHQRGGQLRLDLRRVDLATGGVRQAFVAQGADPFALVDRLTADLAAGYRAGSPVELRIADVTTSSLAAYRLYEEGLRSYHQQNDADGALRLFTAALREDSRFAMAAYYASQAALTRGSPSTTLIDRARRLADRATERERLLIQSAWAFHWDEPAGLAPAETLATRYPAEPDGHYFRGVLLRHRGDFLGAVPHLRRAIDLDSLSLLGKGPRCRACDAYFHLIEAHVQADSLEAAERAAREYVRLQPQSSHAWIRLADLLDYGGRRDAALEAHRVAERIRPGPAHQSAVFRAAVLLRAGAFDEVSRLLLPLLRDTAGVVQSEALWLLVISRRYQGRLREALDLARLYRRVNVTDSAIAAGLSAAGPVIGALPEAVVLYEMGRGREASAIFDSIAALAADDTLHRARSARHRAWMLTHAATALAVAGDTARLAALADTIESLGSRTGYGRDHRLHHHIRGLLWRARGGREEAEAAFRRAIFSPTMGYTRTNLELGRLLLERKQPREAIAVLRPALRGPLQASNLYVTHTELHELLGRAFDAVGEADSAAAHLRWVVDAWRASDRQFRPRLVAARLRLAALGR